MPCATVAGDGDGVRALIVDAFVFGARQMLARYGDAGLKIRTAVGQQYLDEVHGRAMEKGVRHCEPVIAEGDPAESILRTAREHGADLIVLGTRGLGKIRELLVGSVSHKVTHLADQPCLLVR